MKIVYLIGNGFDINLGLKTSFRNFYDYYLKQESLDETVKKFKTELDKNIEVWSDLEVALGNYAEHFSKDTVLDFRNLLIDIQDNLATYINLQKRDFVLSDKDKIKLYEDLFNPEKYLTERERVDFKRYKNIYGTGNYYSNVITFNYTDTFEKLYAFNGNSKQIGTHSSGYNNYQNILNSVEHIHGTTASNMILGINDESQLNNEELRKHTKAIRSIVKPEMNKNAGTLRDERSLNLIKEADLICIFGMSLGETDSIWWKLINNRLINSSASLIIFSKIKGNPEIRNFLAEDDKDEIKNRFLSYSKFNDEQKNRVFSKIFVAINSKMFGISNLPETKVA